MFFFEKKGNVNQSDAKPKRKQRGEVQPKWTSQATTTTHNASNNDHAGRHECAWPALENRGMRRKSGARACVQLAQSICKTNAYHITGAFASVSSSAPWANTLHKQKTKNRANEFIWIGCCRCLFSLVQNLSFFLFDFLMFDCFSYLMFDNFPSKPPRFVVTKAICNVPKIANGNHWLDCNASFAFQTSK